MTPAATEQPLLSISVRNFGPVGEGRVQLKPLTVLIGPNNTGKSYLALLIYALTKVLRGGRRGVGSPISRDVLGRVREEVRRWGEQPDAFPPLDGRALSWPDLPVALRAALRESVSDRFDSLRPALETGFQDYFGVDHSSDLVRRYSRSPLDVQVSNGSTLLSLNRRRTPEDLVIDRLDLDLDARAVELPGFWPADLEFAHYQAMEAVWNGLIGSAGVPLAAHYLPAARSGIMNGWQVYASLAVETLRRRVGTERIELHPFTGVAGDFLQVLLERLLAARRRRPVPKGMQAALDVLEGEILEGEVVVDEERSNQRTLLYRDGQFKLSLHRASSMIAELAPLDLWIRYLVRPGELLIIDEPEAHQHPENQRRIARVLVRLARAGVKVLCTTHSSLILHQLSNHLLASETPAPRRSQLKFGDADVLRPDELGVYLFEPPRRSTRIREIEFEPGFGIPEDEFVRVSEAVGEETFALTHRA